MPKPGGRNREHWKPMIQMVEENDIGYNNNRIRRPQYNDEHDDRDRKPATQRRVSFKPSLSGQRHGLKARLGEMAIRSHIEDDDVMGEYSDRQGNKGNRLMKGRRKGSPIPKGRFGGGGGSGSGYNNTLKESSFGWYQVTIPYGQKYNKDDIIRFLLNAISPEIFIPHYWKIEKNCISFFIDDFKIAERLINVNRKIQMPDGFHLSIRIRPGTPIVNIDDQIKERIKLAMAKRYNAQTKALDLSQFHKDPDFKDMFCGLIRPNVMSTVVDIISKNIPDLEALNLANNQIQQFESFKNCSEKIPNLKILHLSDNKIHAIAILSVFRLVPIEELVIDNNPLKYRYKDKSQFVSSLSQPYLSIHSEIRRKFPKLRKLDGEILEPMIGFDVLDLTKLPNSVATFFCNQNGVDIVRAFLKQYFLIYDSDNRQPLLDAYHEQALLSLTCTNASQGGRLSNYWSFNRNLLRQQEQDAKFRLLKFGRLPVVSFLSELPKTQHDLMSFSVDLSIFMPTLISFTVAGVFKDLNSDASNPEIRSFQRLVIIVPGANGGFSIRNEMITISNATQGQVKSAFKETVNTAQQPQSLPQQSVQQRIQGSAANEPMPSTSQISIPSSSSIVNTPDDNTKLQMIQAMSNQSHMNLEWSKKCLMETNWDFAHAAYVFDKLHKENKIPAEAFIK